MNRWLTLPLDFLKFFLLLLLSALLLFVILSPLFFLFQAHPFLLNLIMGIILIGAIIFALLRYQRSTFARFFLAFLSPPITLFLCAVLVSNSKFLVAMITGGGGTLLFFILLFLAFHPTPFSKRRTIKRLIKKVEEKSDFQ